MATIVSPGFALNVTVKYFLFETSTIKIFNSYIHKNSEMNKSSVGKYSNDYSILTLNPPPNLNKLLLNQLNELTAESNKKKPENFISWKNLDIDEIQMMKIEPNSLSLFHINSYSLNKTFEDLEYLLTGTLTDI